MDKILVLSLFKEIVEKNIFKPNQWTEFFIQNCINKYEAIHTNIHQSNYDWHHKKHMDLFTLIFEINEICIYCSHHQFNTFLYGCVQFPGFNYRFWGTSDQNPLLNYFVDFPSTLHWMESTCAIEVRKYASSEWGSRPIIVYSSQNWLIYTVK